MVLKTVVGALGLVAALAGAPPANAQAGFPSGPPGAEDYRLTLSSLRAVLPAVQAGAGSRCEKPEKKRDRFAMTLAEMTAALERCAPVRAELANVALIRQNEAELRRLMQAFDRGDGT